MARDKVFVEGVKFYPEWCINAAKSKEMAGKDEKDRAVIAQSAKNVGYLLEAWGAAKISSTRKLKGFDSDWDIVCLADENARALFTVTGLSQQ